MCKPAPVTAVTPQRAELDAAMSLYSVSRNLTTFNGPPAARGAFDVENRRDPPIICMTAPNHDSLLNYCRHRSCCGSLHSPNEHEPWRLQIACGVRALKVAKSVGLQDENSPALKCVSNFLHISPPQNLEFQPSYSLAPRLAASVDPHRAWVYFAKSPSIQA